MYKDMERIISFIAGLFIFLQLFFTARPFPISFNNLHVKVEYVIDGDTIVIEGGKKVRYIGINTSEIIYPTPGGNPLFECYAKEAKQENEKLVLGKTVRLVKDVSDTDKYGRLLRYVYVDNLFVNDYMVKHGYAKTMMIKPDTAYFQVFNNSQNEAKIKKIGLWLSCQKNN